jgi:hypothetical protein
MIDLQKMYPNYFTKWVFRSVVIVMVVIFFYIMFLNNFSLKYSPTITCNSNQPCLNKFYICNHEEYFLNDNCKLESTSDISFWNCMKNQTYVNDQYFNLDCNYIKMLGCDYGICDDKYIQPKQIIGKQPSKLFNMLPMINILIIILGFIANHLLYKWRNKHE